MNYPQIYYELSNEHNCTIEDLFRATIFKSFMTIEKAAKLFDKGYSWIEIKRLLINYK